MYIKRTKPLFIQIIELIQAINQTKIFSVITQEKSILVSLYTGEAIVIIKVKILNYLKLLI